MDGKFTPLPMKDACRRAGISNEAVLILAKSDKRLKNRTFG